MAQIATAGPYVACSTAPEDYRTHVATLGLGWFVMAPTGAAHGDLNATAKLLAGAPAMRGIIAAAERFVAGFEDDSLQQGISGTNGLLGRLRAVLDDTPPAADPVKHQLMQALAQAASFLRRHADAVPVDRILDEVETALAVGRGDASATTVADKILKDLIGAMPVPNTAPLAAEWSRAMRYVGALNTRDQAATAPATASAVAPDPVAATGATETIKALCSWIYSLTDTLDNSDAALSEEELRDITLAREAAATASEKHGVEVEVPGYSVSPSLWRGTGDTRVHTTFIVYTPAGARLEDDYASEADAWAAARAHATRSPLPRG
jgi:hypothetical protein